MESNTWSFSCTLLKIIRELIDKKIMDELLVTIYVLKYVYVFRENLS